MAMTTAQELFLHELGDLYDAEQRISKMLVTLAKENDNAQVKSAFEHHEQETLQQIENLKQCFKELDSSATAEKSACHAVAGMKQEHDSFLKEEPSAEILTMYDLSGAAKTEHYEITAYKDLIEKATLMGQAKVVTLLQENLKQEEAMARKVQHLSSQLGKQLISASK